MLDKSKCDISVVMSVYNTEKYLKKAIDSILNQTFTDFEFIIINDGSTDGSLEIIQSYNDARIILINQSNQGLSKSLNNGIRISKGKYIARMDADDISNCHRLEKQFNFLEKNVNCVVVGSNANLIDLNGTYLYVSNNPCTWDEIKKVLPKTIFFHSSTMFIKDVFNKCDGYMEEVIQFFEDGILWNRMVNYGEFCNLSEALIDYRIVPTSITISKPKNKEFSEIYTRVLADNSISDKDIETLKELKKNKQPRHIIMSNYYLRIGKIYLEFNFNRRLAIKNLIISLTYQPYNHIALFNLFISFMPRIAVNHWKAYRGVYQN